MEDTIDPTGFITNCVQQLLSVGFDASAFETAKYVGIACIIALGAFAIVTFGARLWRGDETAAILGENQFRWVLYMATLLIALPIVAKLTSDQFEISFQSGDRAFAQRICEDQMNAVAQNAESRVLETRISTLESELATLAQLARDSNPAAPQAVLELPPLAGAAISMFYRTNRRDDVLELAKILEQDGGGASWSETDLTESSFSKTAIRGDVYVIYDGRGVEYIDVLQQIMSNAGFAPKELRESKGLSGTPVQILLF